MSAPELKPCPFCGGNIKLLESKNGSIVTFACQEDSSCIGTGLYILANPEKLSSAITSWNTRFPASEITALNAEVERLKSAQTWQPIETIKAANGENPMADDIFNKLQEICARNQDEKQKLITRNIELTNVLNELITRFKKAFDIAQKYHGTYSKADWREISDEFEKFEKIAEGKNGLG